MACRAELAKYPMIIDINKTILNYLRNLREKDDKYLQMSIDLYNSGQNAFKIKFNEDV